MSLFVNNVFVLFHNNQYNICTTDNHFALGFWSIIDNQHTSTKSCLNFRVRKGPSDELSGFDLKDLLSLSERATFTVHMSRNEELSSG